MSIVVKSEMVETRFKDVKEAAINCLRKRDRGHQFDLFIDGYRFKPEFWLSYGEQAYAHTFCKLPMTEEVVEACFVKYYTDKLDIESSLSMEQAEEILKG